MALLSGTVVVVSGVGPGLGRSIALASAREGADLVLAARTAARLDEVAKEVTALGQRAVTVPADITDERSAAHLAQAALDAFGRVDTLVHNAFAIPPLTSLADADLAALRTAFDTNVIAVLRHSRLPYGGYKMAKSALLALAQSLATELGPQGIRVNSVAPGYIWAGSLKWYFGYLAEQRGVDRQQIYDETAATTDLRKLPEPDEVADAVVFLASSMARAITGQCLDVNSGEYHH